MSATSPFPTIRALAGQVTVAAEPHAVTYRARLGPNVHKICGPTVGNSANLWITGPAR